MRSKYCSAGHVFARNFKCTENKVKSIVQNASGTTGI